MNRSTCLRRLGLAVLGMLLALPGTVVAQEEAASPAPTQSAAPAAPVVTTPEGAWQVQAFDPWAEGPVEPLEGSNLRLSLLGESRLQGSTGCGRFEGGYSLEGELLWLGVAPTGHLGCREDRTAEAIGLSAALDAVRSWRVAADGGAMELLDERDAVRVVLLPLTGAGPVGEWSVASYAKADGTLVEPDPEAPMSMVLGADGSASGSTGCRLFEGAYRLAGESIAIGPVETVGLRCEQPERKAERRLLAVFGEASYWERTDEVLTLSDAFGQPLLVLQATEADASSP